MMVVLVAGVLLAAFVTYRERKRRRAAYQLEFAVAQANYTNATLTRQVAEIALAEYLQGIYPEDLKAIDAEIALAKSDAVRARERLARADQPAKDDPGASAARADSEKAARHADLRQQRADQKKAELVGRTRDNTVKDLKSEIERARADELAKKSTYDRLAAMASQY
jgi:hypothetical protein